jgi:hypothetical protein
VICAAVWRRRRKTRHTQIGLYDKRAIDHNNLRGMIIK